jgi:shikimate dehydrogenase
VWAASAAVVFDVVYHPRQTPFLLAATRQGCQAIPGFELLLHQAARQVELMTGTKLPPLDEMRAAGLEALAQR